MTKDEHIVSPRHYRVVGEDTPRWLSIGLAVLGTLTAVAVVWMAMTGGRPAHRERHDEALDAVQPPVSTAATPSLASSAAKPGPMPGAAVPAAGTPAISADPGRAMPAAVLPESGGAPSAGAPPAAPRIAASTSAAPQTAASTSAAPQSAASTSAASTSAAPQSAASTSAAPQPAAATSPVPPSVAAAPAVPMSAAPTAATPASAARECPPPLTVLFRFDSARALSERPGPAGDPLLDWLRRHPDARLSVQGHADAVGSDQHNLLLSYQRARAVAAQLGVAGVPASRIVLSAAGSHELIDGLPAGAGQNRRVVVRVKGYEECDYAAR